MINLRTYGSPPFSVAAVHGGPGDCGGMAPVARELASVGGVLEPIQTETSVSGLVGELKGVLEEHGCPPVTLIGHSWGAWLCFMVAAYCPEVVGKLILVGSGSYEEKYVERMVRVRMGRFSDEERAEYESIIAMLHDPSLGCGAEDYQRLGALVLQADTCDALPPESIGADPVDSEGRDFQPVLAEVLQMRKDGRLLALAHRITCPVVAIHGDYDTRPVEGVSEPLSAIIPNFRMIVLPKCGHNPWIERYARDEFFGILKRELAGEGD